ncbi:LacI family DNA-binding transcriptional regulator [Isoptericola variabilis]|uniref:Transcriptional regulator, LacI family n=1 Tax=Isoptericola variabilis (strain 225) TaxID=743718 RepID=F6FR60_ISOV2|nr:LacI family DNA-binding transcriptional regulator [Isoptericola variabilis]AEG45010.1 transcriptional regulator, LacI family [Isoptericola variabilis 225]TWH26136.1 LacI family transcriptional regulator [Isoptericola variabilis J7]
MATIEDVARAAGVSASTVSYVLSGKRSISAPTRRRVEHAIAELGYRPHAGARALASSRTNVIGLVAPLRSGVDVAVIMQFVTGVVTRAREFDHDVLLLTQDDTGGLERVAAGSMVDAIVVMDVEADDPRIPTLRALRQPTVLIGLPREPAGLSCVDLDFEAVGRLGATHLARTGHTDVALVGSPPEVMARHTSYADRVVRGFREACAEHGLRGEIEPCEPTPAGARHAVDAVLDRAPGTTGLLVHNERALPHVLAHLAERGRAVPDDVSLVAVCPTDVALAQSQPLTSIDIPAEVIGGVAVEMVLSRLRGEQPAETRLLAPVLTERDSTAVHEAHVSP